VDRLAILTSGGDSPGTNAAIEAAARQAGALGVEMLGVQRGFAGLAEGQVRPLTLAEVDGIAARGGTVLGTSRDRTIGEQEGRRRLLATLESERIAGLVLLGGDGSIRYGATALSEMGVACVAIPCTIDNDVSGTDRTVGFDSACNRAISLADGIKDTAQALAGRMFLLETLGGQTGFIALAVAEATHADLVFVPEYPIELDSAAEKLRRCLEGRGYALAVASEGAGDVHSMAAFLAEAAGHRIRVTSLGHAQRGGSPTFLDRWLARRFAELAVTGLIEGRSACVTICRGYDVMLAPLAEVAGGRREPDRAAYDLINGLGTVPQ
jgi:6-phosphofructokinase 1